MYGGNVYALSDRNALSDSATILLLSDSDFDAISHFHTISNVDCIPLPRLCHKYADSHQHADLYAHIYSHSHFDQHTNTYGHSNGDPHILWNMYNPDRYAQPNLYSPTDKYATPYCHAVLHTKQHTEPNLHGTALVHTQPHLYGNSRAQRLSHHCYGNSRAQRLSHHCHCDRNIPFSHTNGRSNVHRMHDHLLRCRYQQSVLHLDTMPGL